MFLASLIFLGTVSFFLLTIVRALIDLTSQSGVQSSELGQLLSFSVNGVLILFFAVITIGELKSIVERYGLGQTSAAES
jgi:hypothetical protein